MLHAPRLLGVVTAILSFLGTAMDVARAVEVDPAMLDACPGYNATNLIVDGPRLSARLVLAGKPCNVFGNDIKVLDLAVVYETESRIHLKITDASSIRYEVPKSVLTIYLPKDKFYDFATFVPVDGIGRNTTLTNVNFTTIPLHIRGGVVLPLRTTGAMTTTELRTKDFEFVVAPNANGTSAGSLYVEDGVSIVQEKSTNVGMQFAEGKLCVTGSFAYDVGVKVASVAFFGVENQPTTVAVYPGKDNMPFSYDGTSKVLRVQIDMPLTDSFEVAFH